MSDQRHDRGAGGAASPLQADPQGTDATAFTTVRQSLLDDTEPTDDWGNLIHDEGFLDVPRVHALSNGTAAGSTPGADASGSLWTAICEDGLRTSR